MSKNPVLNALAAAAYIGTLVFILVVVLGHTEQNLSERFMFLMPLTMISVFTLSAAVMGYLFLYQPALLILDGKRAEGTKFFLQTVGSFAAFVVALLTILAVIG